MNITKTQFLDMVLDEANHLRKHATDEEKGRLDFDNLMTISSVDCIS